MGQTILLPLDIHSAGKELLKQHGFQLKIGRGTEEKTICEDVVGCCGIIARTGAFTREVMEAEPGLKVIVRHGTGVDNVDLEAARKLQITVTNDPVSNVNAVAEHVIALLVSCSKNLAYLDLKTRQGCFQIRNEVSIYELSQKTLGVIGFGKIGKLVAKKAALGFDMKVIVYDPFVKEEVPEYVQLIENLDDIFKSSNFISVNLPLTKCTKNSIGKREFALMQKGACFINCARGEIVDEKALIEALEEGKIALAGLDVFQEEPPQKDNPLFKMEQVTLTPHSAALTVEAMEKMSIIAAESIIEVFEGREMTYPVV